MEHKLPLLGQFNIFLSLNSKQPKKFQDQKTGTQTESNKKLTQEESKNGCAVIPVRVPTDWIYSLHINLQLTCWNTDASKAMCRYINSGWRAVNITVPCVQWGLAERGNARHILDTCSVWLGHDASERAHEARSQRRMFWSTHCTCGSLWWSLPSSFENLVQKITFIIIDIQYY